MPTPVARLLPLAGLSAVVPPAAAHAHIFIDTSLEFLFNAEGEVTAVRVACVYDDFTSMLYLSDRAMDPDADGKLTAEEEAGLAGLDIAWDAD